MAQEYFINSQTLEDQVRKLLPSQGGAGAGFDLSASTQIVPIIDLTSAAEDSGLRQDLQTSFSHTNATPFLVSSGTVTIINTTGYYRIFGDWWSYTNTVNTGIIRLNDGTTTKNIIHIRNNSSGYAAQEHESFDFIIKLSAGDSCEIVVTNAIEFAGATRQIADLDGNLT